MAAAQRRSLRFGRPLARDGLVEVDHKSIRITGRGRLLMRIVAMVFDEYLDHPREQVTRFSRVI